MRYFQSGAWNSGMYLMEHFGWFCCHVPTFLHGPDCTRNEMEG